MDQFKTLEEALQFLRGRGKRVVECDANCEVHCGGYRPDALAYDEFNRLVAVVVDNSHVEMTGRVDALREFAELDSRIAFIVIKAPSSMSYEEIDQEPSGDLAYEWGRMFRLKDDKIISSPGSGMGEVTPLDEYDGPLGAPSGE